MCGNMFGFELLLLDESIWPELKMPQMSDLQDPINSRKETSSLRLKILSDLLLFQYSLELISLIGLSVVKGFWLGF